MMHSANRVLVATAVVVSLALGVAGCSGKQTHPDQSKLGAIIDVRIEDKYIYGHLENAIGADYKMDTFRSRVANLSRTGHYGVYGKNRKEVAEAIRFLILMGFKHLNNLGTIDDAQQLTKRKVVM